MINVDVLSNFNSHFPDPNYPFLRKQFSEWRQSKPLRGVRVLHNLINSFETLMKIEALLHAGADLTLSRCHFAAYPYQSEVDAVIHAAGIRYIPNHSDLSGEFDIAMDCAADLLRLERVKILKGCVELTRVGAIAYAKHRTPYPVISVDDSALKQLECMFGTGESFIRAFSELTHEDLTDRKVVLFGFGKVGKGIVKYLLPFTKNIVIVDTAEKVLLEAQQKGLSAISIINIDDIKSAMHDAFVVVTATGRHHFLSHHFTQEDVGNAYLANMGVDDEFGEAFSGSKVLFHKAPINFSLKHPTLMKYFDPICYAHNRAATMLIERDFSPGFHRYPISDDLAIVNEWAGIYDEDVTQILGSK